MNYDNLFKGGAKYRSAPKATPKSAQTPSDQQESDPGTRALTADDVQAMIAAAIEKIVIHGGVNCQVQGSGGQHVVNVNVDDRIRAALDSLSAIFVCQPGGGATITLSYAY